ncbi:MAG: Gfo/Idh/MocA family oxidoreductase [Chloroflexi bacterium]|nr:Gfo/Idh/MocA family oxidoreductase [Chloroflexota bacterium]
MVRLAQIGVKHGHAAGKACALATDPRVEFAGIAEPDLVVRQIAASSPAYAGMPFLDSVDAILGDATIQAIAIEGSNAESVAMAQQAATAGKHIWLDKPAGDDWAAFCTLLETVRNQRLYFQMGYMFRYHPGFTLVQHLARSGDLGAIFAVRGNMSTNITRLHSPITTTSRAHIARHRGGILFDLGGHLIDQIVWLLGRPTAVQAILRNDASADLPAFADNTLATLQFSSALASVEISAMAPLPTARRFEVYGTSGAAILDPLEPAHELVMIRTEPSGRLQAGRSHLPLDVVSRQELYNRELDAFIRVILGEKAPDRPMEHESLVQETLLRAVGSLPASRAGSGAVDAPAGANTLT